MSKRSERLRCDNEEEGVFEIIGPTIGTKLDHLNEIFHTGNAEHKTAAILNV